MRDAIRLVAFDVDGTLAQGNIWLRVHALAGVTPEEDNEWFRKYYNRDITFNQWASFITEKYKTCTRTRKEFEAVMQEVTLVPNAKETVAALRPHFALCLISSGFDFYVHRVGELLGISCVYANYSLVYNKKNIVRDIAYQAPEDVAKVQVLKTLCRARGIKPSDIVYIGDSSNDIPAFEFTKRGILVGTGNDALMRACWKRVEKIEGVVSIILSE